jgi:hypothetical protein
MTKFQNCRDFTAILGSLTGAGLAVDDLPNTTEPAPKRTLTTPRNTSDDSDLNLSLVSDAALTVQGWMWSDTIGRWVRLFEQALVADIVSTITNVPGNVPMTFRVSVNAGTTAKMLGAMFY